MAQPRILINALSWSLGGGNTYALNLMRELDRDPRGFRFTVLVASAQAHPMDRLEISQVRLPTRLAGASLLGRLAYEEALLPFRARSFDLLYCVADIAPPFGTTPTVVALRNLNIYDRTYYDTLRFRVLERLVRLGLPRVRRILFPSRAAADLISRRIPISEGKVAIVPHGVSTDLFEGDTGSQPAKAPYLFVPAPLEPHKNLGVLIRSLCHVSDTALEVWIAGHDTTDPAHAAELRQLVAQLELGQRVRFLGPVPYRQILSYHRGAEALVFPSRLETFGHPLLEAMLAGTPIVASDIPASREIGGDVPIYFDPGAPIELARAVDRIRSKQEETRQRVARGRERAGQFTWARSADTLCAVFEDVLRQEA
ncbi:MAG: glycosyltransferase family 1 protein [Myxococcota bacterium]